MTDKEILGNVLHPKDANEKFVNGKTYSWYATIADELRPRFIGEIGVRYGYSIKALLSGWSENVKEVVTWDNEMDKKYSNQWCREKLAPLFPKIIFEFNHASTQHLESLGNLQFDLIHVDGDNAYENVYHNLCLSWNALRPGGTLLVADCNRQSVHEAFARFCLEDEIIAEYVPTLNGLGMMQKGD